MTRVVPRSGPEDSDAAVMQALVAVDETRARTVTRPPAAPHRVAAPTWSRQLARQLVLADALCTVVAIAIGWATRYGFPSDTYAIAYVGWTLILTLAWLTALQ